MVLVSTSTELQSEDIKQNKKNAYSNDDVHL